MLRCDLHVHSQYSDGHGEYADILDRAASQGLDLVAVTDHWDPHQPGVKDRQLPILPNPATCPAPLTGTRMILGVETGPIIHPSLSQVPLVIASVHYLPSGYPGQKGNLYDGRYWREYQDAVLKLTQYSQVDILGHIAGYLPLAPLLDTETTFDERREIEAQIRARLFEADWYEQVFRQAAATGKAIELHTATKTPGHKLARLAIKLGAKLSIGSDAHTLERVGDIDWAVDLLKQIGAAEQNLYTP